MSRAPRVCRQISAILAIRFARMGDMILLLPALKQLRQNFQVPLSLVTGVRCAEVARLSPYVDEVIVVDRRRLRDGPRMEALQQIARLAGRIRKRGFDLSIDFNGLPESRLLGLCSGAHTRVGVQRFDRTSFAFGLDSPVVEDKSLHVAQQFLQIVDRLAPDHPPPNAFLSDNPPLMVPNAAREKALALTPNHRFLTLFVGAPAMTGRRWPPQRFAEIADFSIQRLQTDVVILGAPWESSLAQSTRQLCQRKERVRTLTDLTIAEVAAVVQLSSVLISNDTGPMHLGPILGVPTLGLFSVGFPQNYRPFGPACEFLKKDLIEQITVEEVIEKINRLFRFSLHYLPPGAAHSFATFG